MKKNIYLYSSRFLSEIPCNKKFKRRKTNIIIYILVGAPQISRLKGSQAVDTYVPSWDKEKDRGLGFQRGGRHFTGR